MELATPTTAETLPSRIQKLLGQGLTGTVVAAAVGCDPSYISQLMEDEEFKSSVLLARATNAEGAVKRDKSWDNVEEMALDKAVQLLPLITRPNDLIRIAAMANAAKRRASEYAGGSESAAPVVNIILPQAAAVHFQMNSNSQVVEVDGRSMAALPTKHLVDQIKSRREAREMQGVIDVMPAEKLLPTLQQPSRVETTERKKVESILERIGFADEAVPVPKVL